jgi:hypothetical protein
MFFSKTLRRTGVLICFFPVILMLLWPTLAFDGHLSFVMLYASITGIYLICWARALEEDYPLFKVKRSVFRSATIRAA